MVKKTFKIKVRNVLLTKVVENNNAYTLFSGLGNIIASEFVELKPTAI